MSASNVKKCPACGATIQKHTTICPECGYVIEDNTTNSVVKAFNEGLSTLLKSKDKDALEAYVMGFSIPNNKTDLLEFISVLKTMSHNNLVGDACLAKYDECIRKTKVLFPNDPTFKMITKQEEEEEKKKDIGFLKALLPLVLFGLICGGLSLLLGPSEEKSKAKTDPDLCSKRVMTLLAADKTDEAKKCMDEYSSDLVKVTDAYSALINSLLEEDKLVDAKSLNDRFVSQNRLHYRGFEEPIFKYMLKKGMYEDAEDYCGTIQVSESAKYERYYEYLKECVEGMCKEGNKEDAKRFLNRKVVFFSDLSQDNKYSEKAVLEKLNRVINSY